CLLGSACPALTTPGVTRPVTVVSYTGRTGGSRLPDSRGATLMADQSISCPSCGKKIPLTRALRADIEASLKAEFEHTLEQQQRTIARDYERRLADELERAHRDAAAQAEQKQ